MMTSSGCVAVALLCISYLAVVESAPPIAQQDLQTLREYLVRQEELLQPEDQEEQQREVVDLADAQFANTPDEVVNDEPTQDGDEKAAGYNERVLDDSESYLQEERSLKNKDKNTSAGGARDKSGGKKSEPIDAKLKVGKAENYRYGGNGPFYTDFGVVVTLEDNRRLLIRKNVYETGFKCWTCKDVSIIYADYMTNNWELLTSKEPTKSTIGDYVRECASASSRKAAVDAMMKLN